MAGLLDIAPPEARTETIDIRGTLLEVRGLRNREWAIVLNRFPQLRRREGEEGGGKPGGTVDEDSALASLDAIVPVIAAGLGKIGDRETEAQILERLSDEEQGRLFAAIMRLTLPAPGPLADAPAAAGDGSEPGTTTTAPMP